MRLGVFGGTFDPVHYGHLLLAESCREQIGLDQVWFLPAAVPPHKQTDELTSAESRVEMLELAIGGYKAFSICRHEIDRGGVNYTVDTLAHLSAEDESRELFFLMGADSLRDLMTWKEPARVCQLAQLVVVARDEIDLAQATDLTRQLTAAIGGVTPGVHWVTMPRIDLSSHEIRARVASGRSIRYQTPRAVEKYIAAGRLYVAP